MCLCRIDYNARPIQPEQTIGAWKVFRLLPDGRVMNCYPKVGEMEFIPGTWHSDIPGIWLVRGKRGMSYRLGFHGSVRAYAERLCDYHTSLQAQRYRQRVARQLDDITGNYYWQSADKTDPLQVTVQPPQYKYVVLRVLLCGVQTIGRQRFNGRTYRTWVASELFLPDQS